MDSSVSATRGEWKTSVRNGHYEFTCKYPLFVFNRFGDLERCVLRAGNYHAADGWEGIMVKIMVKLVVARQGGRLARLFPGRRGLRQSLYEISIRAHQVCDPSVNESHPAGEDRPFADPAGGTAVKAGAARSYANFYYQSGSWTSSANPTCAVWG